MALSSYFPLPKTLHSSKQYASFATKFCFCQMAWQGIESLKQTMEPSSSKQWIKLIPKTIGNRKRDCAWGCARGIDTTWENMQIEKHKSGRRSLRSPDWFVLFDLQIFSGGVYRSSATSRTISFSISKFLVLIFVYFRGAFLKKIFQNNLVRMVIGRVIALYIFTQMYYS